MSWYARERPRDARPHAPIPKLLVPVGVRYRNDCNGNPTVVRFKRYPSTAVDTTPRTACSGNASSPESELPAHKRHQSVHLHPSSGNRRFPQFLRNSQGRANTLNIRNQFSGRFAPTICPLTDIHWSPSTRPLAPRTIAPTPLWPKRGKNVQESARSTSAI